MFALIETKGASHIAIHIPKEGANKSLPAIAAMLEHNATFINKGWREIAIVNPAMSITLGDKIEVDDGEGGELIVKSGEDVLSDDFVIATPDVFLSNKKAMQKKQEEIDRVRSELQATKYQLDAANARIAELTGEEDVEGAEA